MRSLKFISCILYSVIFLTTFFHPTVCAYNINDDARSFPSSEQDYKQALQGNQMALKKLHMAAADGSSEACYQLALVYKNGVNKDLCKAAYYFNEANTDLASLELGKMFYQGEPFQQNYETAYTMFLPAAKTGNSEALMYIGKLYLNDQLKSQDLSEEERIGNAEYFLTTAVKLGNTDAMHDLGLLYKDKYYLEKKSPSKQTALSDDPNLQQAYHWQSQAYKNNNEDASVSLAFQLIKGEGVKQDPEKGIDIFHKFIKNLSADSSETELNLCVSRLLTIAKNWPQNASDSANKKLIKTSEDLAIKAEKAFYGYRVNILLADWYREGKFVTKDLNKSIKWLKRVDNDHLVNYTLGEIYEKDLNQLDKAIPFYEKSAILNSNAKLKMAQLYEEGKVVKKDLSRAYQYYLELSLKDNIKNSEVFYSLGNMYEQGLGTNQNFDKAIRNFIKAAALNNVHALYRAGLLFELKSNTDNMLNSAIFCYILAAEKGDNDARERLKEIAENTSSSNKVSILSPNYAITIAKSYIDSLATNNSEAQLSLGVYFESESTSDLDVSLFSFARDQSSFINSRAIHWLTLSAQQENLEALRELISIFDKKIDFLNTDGSALKYQAQRQELYKTLLEVLSKQDNLYDDDALLYNYYQILSTIDPNKYVQRLESDAQKGSSLAAGILGELYFEGQQIVPQDFNKAEKWLALNLNYQYKFFCNIHYYRAATYLKYSQYIDPDHKLALKAFDTAAKCGSSKAFLTLSEIYQDGKYFTKNLKQASFWYEKYLASVIQQAQQNDTKSIEELIDIYQTTATLKQYSSLQEQFCQQYIDILKTQGQQGNLDALKALSSIYETGKFVKKDPIVSLFWYNQYVTNLNQKSEAGDLDAKFELAEVFLSGKGVARDGKKAIELYMQSQKPNKFTSDGTASYIVLKKIGDIYYSGIGVNADKKLANQYYAQAFEQAKADGNYYFLSDLYAQGKGVSQDLYQATLAILKTNNLLAVKDFYVQNCSNNNQPFCKIAKDFIDAKESPNPDNCYQLGLFHKSNSNLSAAKDFFRQAMDLGNTKAWTEMGDLFHKYEVEKSNFQSKLIKSPLILAAIHYGVATGQNDAYAKLRLIMMRLLSYQLHIGITIHDLDDVSTVLEKDAASGNDYAQLCLGIISEINGFSKKYRFADYVKASEIYSQLAKKGNATAKYNLGLLYLRGLGLPQDRTKAKYWFQQAANQNLAAAQYRLAIMAREDNNTREFLSWCLLSAQNGYSAAANLLGEYYAQQESDDAKSEQFLSQAQQQGYYQAYLTQAAIDLAKDDYFSAPSVAIDRAIEYGKINGYLLKLYLYQKDRSINLSDKDILTAALLGAPEAHVLYNYSLTNKAFLTPEEKKICFLQNAVNQNYARAMSQLAYYYLKGKALPRDYYHAAELADKSCSLGNEEGCYIYNLLRLQGIM